MIAPSVAHTGELQRVAALPRRVWSPEQLAELAGVLTEILRTPASTPCPDVPGDATARARLGLCPTCGQPLTLKPAQALGLHDAGVERGLFGPLGVGEGKTLLSLLLPVVLQVDRPLLLLPGGLVEKTQRERLALSYHWRVSTALRAFSYDRLGRVDAVDELETYAPDAIICDEVHRLKNKRAAVTRRVARYMHAHPETIFCGLSGTIMDKSLVEFAHIVCWCLKWGAPVPTSTEEIEEWAAALDEPDPKAYGADVRQPGALLTFCTPEELARDRAQVAARHGFRRRLTETPGVVATIGEGEHVDASIYLRGIVHKVSAEVEGHFEALRRDWITPDGWELLSGADVYRHAQELALGLHYVWDPRPPPEWLTARRNWGAFVRDKISRSRTWDSELHVANAVDAGDLDDMGVLAAWRAIEPTFVPNVVPVWHDSHALDTCRAWMRSPGIVWTEHGFFAQRLAEVSGCSYFGAGGFDAAGRYIEDASPKEAVIASIDANREGKNLQRHWHRSLYVCPPKSAAWIEQSIARIHRPGQESDEVIVDVLLGCRENFDNILAALAGARAIYEITGKRQKLLLADVTLPTEQEIDAFRTPRWVR